MQKVTAQSHPRSLGTNYLELSMRTWVLVENVALAAWPTERR